MMIYYHDFNNNMCTNEPDRISRGGESSEKVEYSENYDSDSELMNGYAGGKPSSCTSSTRERRFQCSDSKSNSISKNVSRGKRSKHIKPPISNSKPPVIKKTGHSSVYTHPSAVDRWEAAQLALAEANSQNILLQRQLQECRVELRTVQRQCKMQSARLNKAIGQEADMPQIVDRLTADIRALQIRLREKTAQYDASQRRISDLQHRVYVLEKEKDDYQAQALNDDSSQRRQGARLDEVQNELQAEKKKTAALMHQLELESRSHKHQTGLAQEQIKQLRRACRDLESQLNERTQLLQEKIKLLELQNIYSLRLPKNAQVHLPPANAMRTLTPDSQDGSVMKHDPRLPALVRSHKQSNSRLRGTDQNRRKISVSLGRRGRRTRSYECSDMPNLEAGSTHMPLFTNLDSETFQSSRIEQNVVPDCGSMMHQDSTPNQQSPKDQLWRNGSPDANRIESGLKETTRTVFEVQNDNPARDTNHQTSSGLTDYSGDKSAEQSRCTRDEMQRFTVSNGKTALPMEFKAAENSYQVEEFHAQLTRLSDETEQLRLIASQQHRPIDVTAATQGPQTSGLSQTSSRTVSKHEGKSEQERKTQILRTLDALEQSLTRDEESSLETSMRNSAEITEDFGRFNTKREKELWDELFGSDAKSDPALHQNPPNILCGHAGLMAKTNHGDAAQNSSDKQSLMHSNTHAISSRLGESQSRLSISPLEDKHGTMVDATLVRQVLPRQADFRALEEEHEADSEFEEFHA